MPGLSRKKANIEEKPLPQWSVGELGFFVALLTVKFFASWENSSRPRPRRRPRTRSPVKGIEYEDEDEQFGCGQRLRWVLGGFEVNTPLRVLTSKPLPTPRSVSITVVRNQHH